MANLQQLQLVRETILAEQEHFWYNAYFVDLNDSLKFRGDLCFISREDMKHCGTKACIAGWTLTLNDVQCARSHDIKDKAAELLGLTDEEATFLFYGCFTVEDMVFWINNDNANWPKYILDYLENYEPSTPQYSGGVEEAVRRIDCIINHHQLTRLSHRNNEDQVGDNTEAN